MPNRKILCEQLTMGKMQYINESRQDESGRHYLGRFEGIAADLNNKTRNGRKYPVELWKKVIDSEDFKDGMLRKVIYGEAGHPADRLETDINKVAICLTDLQIREDEGIVWASFDILDTPSGRIIKELCDYGSQLGVSSRGSGEEVADQNGEVIIDPETYYFVCFDSVIMPAVSKAIPSVTESVDLEKQKSLVESVKLQVENASTVNELKSIKAIIEAIKMPELDSVLESINNKLSDVSNGDDISSKLMKDLGESSQKLTSLNERYESLKKRHTADNIRYKNLRESFRSAIDTSRSLREKLNESRRRISELESDLIDSSTQCSEFSDSMKSLKNENSRIREKLSMRISESKRIFDKGRSYKNRLDEALSKIDELKSMLDKSNESLSREKSKSIRISESLRKASSDIDSLTKENNNLKSENKQITAKYNKAASSYLKLKSSQYGVMSESVMKILPESYSISDIDSAVSKISDRSDRMSRMPISIPVSDMSVSYPVTESFSKSSDEDDQTKAIVEGMLKSK